MQWSDEGIVISTRRHGESSVVVELLTRAHGRHGGMVRGGRGKRLRPVLQLGNKVRADWKARLPEHLGMYVLEPAKLRAALVMDDATRLLALQSVCALLGHVAEREPHPHLFEATETLLGTLAGQGQGGAVKASYGWQVQLVVWELGLLSELGFGLDLTCCAATGTTENLVYVSPRSGRAVSGVAGEPYRDKLLPLPPFLVRRKGEGYKVKQRHIAAGLALSRYFLEKHLLSGEKQNTPYCRVMLEQHLSGRG